MKHNPGALLGAARNSIYRAATVINAVGWLSTLRVNGRRSVMDLVVAAERQNVNVINLTMKKNG